MSDDEFDDDLDTPDTLSAAGLFTAYELARLQQAELVLANITAPDIAPIAARVGYDAEEHRYGWEQLTIAKGVNVPFSHYLSDAQQKMLSNATPAQRSRYRVLDRFENKWFPRTRTAIRRFIAQSMVEAFEMAFFADLKQQPRGPGVVGSVEGYLNRTVGFSDSDVPGARQAFESLVKRGLTESAIQHMRSVIEACRKEPQAPEAPAVDPQEIAKTAEERRAAYDNVVRWCNDWSETLRGEVNYHQGVRLGIMAVKGGKKGPKIPDGPPRE